MSHQSYSELTKNDANYVPLTPLSFLYRSATVFAHHTAVIYGNRQYTWAEVYKRCIRLADALRNKGIGLGDTVSIISPNTPAMVEAHFGVAMAGAVLNAINIRLDKDTITYILGHSDCRLVIVDVQYIPIVKEIIAQQNLDISIVRIDDESVTTAGIATDDISYEEFLASGDETFSWLMPKDEWQALTLNYTSGTSGRPKGVVYHHRGAYLMSMGTAVGWDMSTYPTYMYIVPLFHCNGWCHVWTVCMMGGTIVCCRTVSAKAIFDAIENHKVTHFGGAPIVLGLLINAKEEEKRSFSHRINVITAGAPPPPAILRQAEKMGFEVMQAYGLTETYGHITQCLWKDKWNSLSDEERFEIKSWQGILFPIGEDMAIQNIESGELIPHDAKEQGEILIRGNTVMKGYYKNLEATEKAFANGWFHTGDAAIWHEDTYLQIRDRLKDVIISGGENISSVEVEGILFSHPAVLHAAVVAKTDEKWGEVPCAFIEVKDGCSVDKNELDAFCRERLAGFKVPKHYVFDDIPKTSTGKTQKFALIQKLKDSSN